MNKIVLFVSDFYLKYRSDTNNTTRIVQLDSTNERIRIYAPQSKFTTRAIAFYLIIKQRTRNDACLASQ